MGRAVRVPTYGLPLHCPGEEQRGTVRALVRTRRPLCAFGRGYTVQLIHLPRCTSRVGTGGTSRLRTKLQTPPTPKNEAIPKKMKQFGINLQNENEVQTIQMWGNEKKKVKRERREVENEIL